MRESIHELIRTGPSDATFERLALELFAHQFERVPMYRRFCERRGFDPTNVRDWRAIPAIPSDAFRHGLTDGPGRPHVFLSSGTTAPGEARSRHALATLDTYRLSALTHFDAMVMADRPGPLATLILGPTANTHPQSSLGQMFSWVAERHASSEPLVAFDARGAVLLDEALPWLDGRAAGAQPVMILGVSSAVTALLDAVRRSGTERRLPADSRIVDTGGAKAYAGAGSVARTYSARALLKAAWRWLHVPAYMCVNEYGMTELLSQLYDDALAGRVAGRLAPRTKVGPPWVRTVVVDPATLEPVARGNKGLLRHVDLANVESVAAVQTLDVGREVGQGFELLGRARGAEQRGCSALLREIAQATVANG